MITAIAQVLKSKLEGLTWIERFTGLVVQAEKLQFITASGVNGQAVQVPNGKKIYAVACDVSEEQCYDNEMYKQLIPTPALSAVAFFVDTSGVSTSSVGGVKGAIIRQGFDIKFLLWMNLNKLGQEDCNFSGKIAPYLLARFYGKHSADGVFGGAIQEQLYKNIQVTKVRQLMKTPDMFRPFSFVDDGTAKGLFLHPYDYLGLSITGTFDIDKNCLPAYVPVEMDRAGVPIFSDSNCIVP